MDPVLIRPAAANDLDGLLSLYQELAEDSPVKMPAHSSQSRLVLKTILDDPVRHLHVAVTSTRIVGTADLLVVTNLTHQARPWAVIENVIVTASARRQGIGAALLQHLVQIASSAGCYKVQLHSGKQRAQAHDLYKKIGFKAVAEGFKLYFDGTDQPSSSSA
jgi:ribosomal protein S18 acetylase RimI-like enzyme